MLLHDRLDLQHGVAGAIEAAALGTAEHEYHGAIVFFRRELPRHGPEQHGDGARRDDERRHTVDKPSLAAAQHAFVGVLEAIESALHQAGRALFRRAFQQFRTHHGRQGQRHEAGKHHRCHQGEGKLGEQPPHVAFQKHQRHEHRHQHRRGGDHGKPHFAGTVVGGEQRRFALLDTAVDIFQHHDGVIHHQPDTQNQRQQGENIDGKAHRVDENRRCHQTDRHRDARNQGGARRAEKRVDHQHHQDHRDAERLVNLVDGALDEDRGIVVFANFQLWRQAMAQQLDGLAGAVGDIHGIGL